nr:monovalent cation/H(+) antiporter subunit G [Saprospiraceae bacterium]
MIEIVSAAVIMTGVIFVFISAIGLVRLPDFYIRVSAITKAATLGVSCIMIGVAIHFNEVGVAIKAVAILVFLLITSPIAAHIIGRAAYEDGVPLWKKTKINEFRDYKEGKLKEKEKDENASPDEVGDPDN